MLIIDRFEEEWAIIEYKKNTFKLPISLMPIGAREGDVIQLDISVNNRATASRMRDIDMLVEQVLKKEG